jgi:hypothetical protein
MGRIITPEELVRCQEIAQNHLDRANEISGRVVYWTSPPKPMENYRDNLKTTIPAPGVILHVNKERTGLGGAEAGILVYISQETSGYPHTEMGSGAKHLGLHLLACVIYRDLARYLQSVGVIDRVINQSPKDFDPIFKVAEDFAKLLQSTNDKI